MPASFSPTRANLFALRFPVIRPSSEDEKASIAAIRSEDSAELEQISRIQQAAPLSDPTKRDKNCIID